MICIRGGDLCGKEVEMEICSMSVYLAIGLVRIYLVLLYAGSLLTGFYIVPFYRIGFL